MLWRARYYFRMKKHNNVSLLEPDIKENRLFSIVIMNYVKNLLLSTFPVCEGEYKKVSL